MMSLEEGLKGEGLLVGRPCRSTADTPGGDSLWAYKGSLARELLLLYQMATLNASSMGYIHNAMHTYGSQKSRKQPRDSRHCAT